MKKQIQYESKIEPAIETVEQLPVVARQMLRSAPSLRPGPEMMDGCVAQHPESLAIRDAWKFRHPVRVISREQFDAMVNRSQVVFHG